MAKNGVIGDLLTELKRKAHIDEESLKEARIYFVQNGKIQKELPLDYPVASILEYHHLIAERIPEDELNAQEGDRAIYAFHFDKEPTKTHGVPFEFYIKPVSAYCLS